MHIFFDFAWIPVGSLNLENFFFYKTNILILFVYYISSVYFVIFLWNSGFTSFRSPASVLHHSLSFFPLSVFLFASMFLEDFLSWYCKSHIWFATSYNLLFIAPKAFWILLVMFFESQILSLLQLSNLPLKFIQKMNQKFSSENFSFLLGGKFSHKKLFAMKTQNGHLLVFFIFSLYLVIFSHLL